MPGKRLAAIMVIGWSLAALAGLDGLITRSMATLESLRPQWEAHAVSVRRFVFSGDARELTSRPASDLPYPSAPSLIEALQQPILRRLLPPAVRHPIEIQPRIVTNEAFVPYGTVPVTPNDPTRPVWGSHTARGNPAVGNFETQAITSCQRGAHLRVPVAGYLGLADLSLAVRAVATGETREIKPDRLAGEDWVSVTVPCPDGPFVMVGADRRPDSWFAFRAPVEIGWASVRAERLIAGSFRLMLAALALMVLALKST